MRGLKTQESEKFNRFWLKVQEAAKKNNSVFFGFAGEGNDIVTDDFEGEDFSGWLIPEKLADEFETEWCKTNELDMLERWSAFFKWAVWETSGEAITINFEKFGE